MGIDADAKLCYGVVLNDDAQYVFQEAWDDDSWYDELYAFEEANPDVQFVYYGYCEEPWIILAIKESYVSAYYGMAKNLTNFDLSAGEGWDDKIAQALSNLRLRLAPHILDIARDRTTKEALPVGWYMTSYLDH